MSVSSEINETYIWWRINRESLCKNLKTVTLLQWCQKSYNACSFLLRLAFVGTIERTMEGLTIHPLDHDLSLFLGDCAVKITLLNVSFFQRNSLHVEVYLAVNLVSRVNDV